MNYAKQKKEVFEPRKYRLCRKLNDLKKENLFSKEFICAIYNQFKLILKVLEYYLYSRGKNECETMCYFDDRTMLINLVFRLISKNVCFSSKYLYCYNAVYHVYWVFLIMKPQLITLIFHWPKLSLNDMFGILNFLPNIAV